MKQVDLRLVTITAKDMPEAKKIADALLEQRLIACANIIDHVRSLYRWKGDLCDEAEVIIQAKTRAEHMPAITQAVRSLHSYDCPCIIAVPITEGDADFLEWIRDETDPG